MDQPYSRIADSLLDYQYWSPNDPQKTPYDDTGWTFPELFNVQAVRVADVKVLDAPMEKVAGRGPRQGRRRPSTGSVFVVNHNADIALVTLRYRFKDASFEAAEEPFDAGGQEVQPRLVHHQERVGRATCEKAAADLGLQIVAVAAAPSVKTHPLRAPRVALLHTWLRTQNEGWWRQAFDGAQVPYTYISTQQIANDANLNAKYDVIVFPPVGRGPEGDRQRACRCGAIRCRGRRRAETPNLGSEDQTDDMRPGLGWTGVAQPAGLRAQGRAVPHRDGHRRARGVDRLHAGPLGRRAPAAAHRRQRRALEDDRRDQPDRLRLHRQPRALVRQRSDLQPLERVRRPRRTPPRARRWRQPADRARHGRRSGRAAGTRRRRGRRASRASTRGRRCRSPTSSCATAST